MPADRCSSVGGTLAGTNSTIGRLPRREVRFDRRQMLRVEPIDDLRPGRDPDTLMRKDVFQGRTEGADAMRLADPEGVQGNAHDPALLCPLGVDRIEIVLDLAGEIGGL